MDDGTQSIHTKRSVVVGPAYAEPVKESMRLGTRTCLIHHLILQSTTLATLIETATTAMAENINSKISHQQR